LLERKPARRIGMLNGRAHDVMNHKWFEGMAWAELEARRVTPPRKPKETDSAKRLKVMLVCQACLVFGSDPYIPLTLR